MFYYSASTRGFYTEQDHKGLIPADAVQCSREKHHQLMLAQCQGKEIRPDANGYPVAADPPPPSDEFLAKLARGQRDVLLTASDWTQQPDVQHPVDVAAAWRTYRQALRDITSQPGFPQNVIWPVVPGGAA